MTITSDKNIDRVTYVAPQKKGYSRLRYEAELIKLSLEKTRHTHGEYSAKKKAR